MKKRSRKKIKKINRLGVKKCPICKRQEILVEHHIWGRDIPNANDHFNVAYICANDHQKIHEGLIIVEKWAMTTN